MEALAETPEIRVPDAERLQGTAEHIHFDPDRPWMRALETARVARAQWNIDHGPISTAELSDLFDIPTPLIIDTTDATVSIPGGLRRERGIGVVLQRKSEVSRRFALARLVGDHLLAPRSDRLLPVTDALTARQKMQRAFAQEFLCPYVDLLDFLGDDTGDDAVESASNYFCVSQVFIDSTLRNNHHPGY
jgi:hypothetical protein